MLSAPLAIEPVTLFLLACLLATIVVGGLVVLYQKLKGTPPPPAPTPQPYDPPLTELLDLLRKINDANPASVSAEDCAKLRDALSRAKAAGLPASQADPCTQIVDRLCPG